MWREYIQQLEPAAEFILPAPPERQAILERNLRVILPDELKELLSESDGVLGNYGLQLIWSVAEIESRNRDYRANPAWKAQYMPLDALLFFADAGNGQLFALSIIHGTIRRSDVYVWNPIDDSRSWAAPSIRSYLEWWLTGKLKI